MTQPGVFPVGYCANVHPARTLRELHAVLADVVRKVRLQVAGQGTLPVGLWFHEGVLGELKQEGEVRRLGDLLEGLGLEVQTLNGFPAGDFHQPVVKHAVYRPGWDNPQRLEFTVGLASVLAELLRDRREGSISTLPLAWRSGNESPDFFRKCAQNLAAWAVHAGQIAGATGRRIRLAIEPEPGCVLDRSADVVRFFDEWLEPAGSSAGVAVRDWIGVCHDVCHSAVMWEPQDQFIDRLDQAGIGIFKVQVSAALEVHFPDDPLAVAALASQVGQFAEPRYLHQTTTEAGGWYADLPEALERADRTGRWRIHFHVPLTMSELWPGIRSTADEIEQVVRRLWGRPGTDWEVETYAWTVLPPGLRPGSLGEGIAGELSWLEQRLPRAGIPPNDRGAG